MLHPFTVVTAAPPSYKLGLNLDGAPQIDGRLFVGREQELAQIQEWLSPVNPTQNVVAISGLGGMGKTQLSLHFAKRCHPSYSAVIWLNANDETALKAAYVALARQFHGEDGQGEAVGKIDEEQAVRTVRQWLSRPENKTWLVVYDNYDDPQLPGLRSSTGYDIRTYFPYSTQGSILITTRSARLTFAKQVRLKKFDDLDQSLAILATRSSRETQGGKYLSCSHVNAGTHI
jgi:AAA ATPase domain